MSSGVLRANVDQAGGLIIEGSPDVQVNGKPVVRVGDKVSPHGPGAHNSPKMIEGSTTVFCNGKPVCRNGDKASCGHTASSGSGNVYVG